ncbi:hypothetical protein BKA56DRAFT_579682 [Ilyonectria sp. MPI-CAGE-AT-0026]|nr:hypothetical protein BKA56DRAFT_579682 [Ilyonectria sp. MPI-CAGE-AT-0026]
MRLHDGKHGHRFTFYSALLIASRHFWANLYSRAWARLLDLWGLAGHWPPTPIAPFNGFFFFLLLDASFDTRFSTCTRDSGYIPGVGNLWWNCNGFGHLLAKVASSDGGGLRIHWLDVIHLLILGFCFFLVFLIFLFFLSLFLSFFGSQHFPPSCTRKDVVLPIRHRLRRLQSAPSSGGAPNQTEDQDWDTGCSQIIEIET